MTIALNGSTGYLNHSARIANSFPFSMAVWVAASTGVSNQFAIQQAQSNGDRYASGWFTSFGGNQLATTRNPGGSWNATKTAAPALSSTVMRLLIVVFESATSRRVYFGSATPASDTAAGVDDISSHDRCTLGGFWANSAGAPSLLLNGSLAEAHWYSTALTGTDYTAMEGGALPETVGGWVDGWTLQTFAAGGVYTSIGGTRTMTAVGGVSTSGIAHPITRGGGDTTAPVLTGSITVGAVTSTSIQMSWPAGSDNVGIAGYDVSSNGGTNYTQLGDVLTHTFTGLTPSTSYQLRVRARDAAGNLSTPVLSATQSTSAPPTASITFGPLRNNTGTLLANETGATVHAYTVAGALAVTKTAQTSNGSGMVTVSDAALTAATEYRYVIVLASGAEGMGRATAA